MATIGKLSVQLTASTAAFIREMDKSRTKATATGVFIGNIFTKIAESAVQMGIRSATAFPHLIQGAIDSADALAKTSQKIGITVEELSGLQHAAKLAGVENAGLTTSVGILSQNMREASRGSKEYADAFSMLGIAVKNEDGTLRSSSAVLEDIADRFVGMPDGAQKTALAMKLLGRSGRDMIPLLNEGAAGLRRNREEAEKLGLVISTRTAKAAEEFNDNLERMGAAVQGVGLQVANQLLGPLNQLTERAIAFITEGNRVEKLAFGIAGAFFVLAKASLVAGLGITGTAGAFALLAEAIQRARLAAAQFTGIGDIEGLKKGLEERQQRTLAIADATQTLLDMLNSLDEAAANVGKTLEHTSSGLDKTGNAMAEVNAETEKAQKQLAAYLEDLKEQNITLGMSVGQLAAYKAAKLGATEAEQAGAATLATGNELLKRAVELNKERASAEWLEATMIRSKAVALTELIPALERVIQLENERGTALEQIGIGIEPRELPSSKTLEEMGKIAASRESIAVAIGNENAKIKEHIERVAQATGKWEGFGRQVSTTLTNMAQGIGDAIVNARSLGDVFEQTAKRIAAALIAHVIEGAIPKLLEALKKIGSSLGGIFGGGGKAPAGGNPFLQLGGGILGGVLAGVGGGDAGKNGTGNAAVFSKTFGAVVDAVSSSGLMLSGAVSTNSTGIRSAVNLGTTRQLGGMDKLGTVVAQSGVRLGAIFVSVGRNIVNAINRAGTKSLIGQVIGAIIAKIPIAGAAQHGGLARRGLPILVGEAGPELFVPDISGTIMPNTELTNLRMPEFEETGAGGSRLLFLEPETQRPIENHFHIQGLISADNLDRMIEKMSRRVQKNSVVFESHAVRTPVRRRA